MGATFLVIRPNRTSTVFCMKVRSFVNNECSKVTRRWSCHLHGCPWSNKAYHESQIFDPLKERLSYRSTCPLFFTPEIAGSEAAVDLAEGQEADFASAEPTPS